MGHPQPNSVVYKCVRSCGAMGPAVAVDISTQGFRDLSMIESLKDKMAAWWPRTNECKPGGKTKGRKKLYGE